MSLSPQTEIEPDIQDTSCEDYVPLLSPTELNKDENEIAADRLAKAEKISINMNQRRFLLIIALGAPTIKFGLAWGIIFSMVYHDSIGDALMHHVKDGLLPQLETIYLPLLTYIPLSGLSLILGYTTFSKYPNVTAQKIDNLIYYNIAILIIQICAIAGVSTMVKMTTVQHGIAYILTTFEGYSIVLIKMCAKRKYNGCRHRAELEMEPRNVVNDNVASDGVPVSSDGGSQEARDDATEKEVVDQGITSNIVSTVSSIDIIHCQTEVENSPS